MDAETGFLQFMSHVIKTPYSVQIAVGIVLGRCSPSAICLPRLLFTKSLLLLDNTGMISDSRLGLYLQLVDNTYFSSNVNVGSELNQ